MRWGSLLVLAVVLTACASETRGRPAPAEVEESPSESGSTSSEPSASTVAERLEIRTGDVRLVATMRDTAAARDLRAQLPARVTMRDHGGVEKTGRLKRPLTVAGQPDGADPDVGDIGYYAPGQDLVLYYGDQSYFDGIVILGHLEGDLPALADLDGDLDVQISRLTNNNDDN
ncbi:MAG: cyclophilin-like fold protein [Aeromicrobium sp.]